MRQVLIVMTFAIASLAHAAGFDCAKAGTSVERLICNDEALSDLDELLSEIFALELDQDNGAVRIRASQKRWLAARNSCSDALCVKQQYENRIAELSCDRRSRMAGSAIGVIRCAEFSLRVLDRELSVLEERYGKTVASESNNPEYTQRMVLSEKSAWRGYRVAQCALYGALEGGSDGWKNAFAGICEVDETRKRIARFKEKLGAK